MTNYIENWRKNHFEDTTHTIIVPTIPGLQYTKDGCKGQWYKVGDRGNHLCLKITIRGPRVIWDFEIYGLTINIKGGKGSKIEMLDGGKLLKVTKPSGGLCLRIDPDANVEKDDVELIKHLYNKVLRQGRATLPSAYSGKILRKQMKNAFVSIKKHFYECEQKGWSKRLPMIDSEGAITHVLPNIPGLQIGVNNRNWNITKLHLKITKRSTELVIRYKARNRIGRKCDYTEQMLLNKGAPEVEVSKNSEELHLKPQSGQSFYLRINPGNGKDDDILTLQRFTASCKEIVAIQSPWPIGCKAKVTKTKAAREWELAAVPHFRNGLESGSYKAARGVVTVTHDMNDGSNMVRAKTKDGQEHDLKKIHLRVLRSELSEHHSL